MSLYYVNNHLLCKQIIDEMRWAATKTIR